MSPGEFTVQVGQRVRGFRRARGWTQADLAERVGMTRASVANLEAGRQNIGIERLALFAQSLDVPPAELLPAPLAFRRFSPDVCA